MNIKDIENRDDFKNDLENLYNSLKGKYSTNDRSNNEIFEHAKIGLLGEYYVMLSSNNINKNYSDDFSYDVISDSDTKIEVKTSNKDTKWYNLSMDRNNKLRISYFLESAKDKKVHKLIRVIIDENKNFKIKFIADAHYFNNYIMRSSFNNEYYYNHERAQSNNHCIVFK